MRICRVLGTVVATAKHPTYHGHKLMVVQPLDEKGERVGASFLAVDVVQAGKGDLVIVMSEGNGVRQILKQQILPIRSLIVGIVDAIDVPGAGTPAARPTEGRRAARNAAK
jgi:ethanolamine utilization protein EutN